MRSWPIQPPSPACPLQRVRWRDLMPRRASPASPRSTLVARLDLSQPQRIHIVGIGGSGMSAIATVLAAMGHEVTGSDLAPSANIERLRALGVAATVGHDAAHVGSADIVTASTAIPPTNVEMVEARRRGVPT